MIEWPRLNHELISAWDRSGTHSITEFLSYTTNYPKNTVKIRFILILTIQVFIPEPVKTGGMKLF